MTDSDGNISQLEAYILQLPENDTPDLNPPDWPMPQHLKDQVPPAPSPFEDYQQYPFHWTGESLRSSPVNLLTSSQPPKSTDRSALIAQFPTIPLSNLVSPAPLEAIPESAKPATRKRRFRQLRRAMSLTNIRHKPTPPDTAPPTPTVPNQVPSSSGIQSLESLTHWQLPDPTAAAPSLGSGNLIVWPSSLVTAPESPRGSYQPPLGQLSPPSSIPSESDILPRESLIGLGIHRSSTSPYGSPEGSPNPSPRTLYPPTLYDPIDLSDPAVLEKNTRGKVIAGTAVGLVAYVTSPDCLDYDVLSDFFMMYRKFMSPTKLLGLLCARFEWGLIRGAVVKPPDNEGMVRVRTFAALRHWLLNYFADDFAPSASLRSQFVKCINSFGRDKRVKTSPRDTRIITELKRCWRTASAVYWDEQGRGNGIEGDIKRDASIPDKGVSQPDDSSSKNRVPSLLFRATRKREERLLGIGPSQSSPDLRRKFVEGAPVNSTRPPPARGHTRIHSTSTIHTRPETPFRHRRNASAEATVIYSKNSNPALYQSFARGDGSEEWPPVIVRADLLVTSPQASSTTPLWQRRKKRLFQSKRKKITGAGDAIPKSPNSLACSGQLSDDEDQRSRRTRKIIPSISTSDRARDRVDFLAAGMWASFVSAASGGSKSSSIPHAEELGEALVQGYIQPMKVDDPRALAVAASLEKGKGVDPAERPGFFDVTMSSSESQAYQTTLSMSEIERRLESARPASIPLLPHTSIRDKGKEPATTRPPSIPLPDTPDSFRRIDTDIRFSDGQFRITPTPPPMMTPPQLPTQPLRRRPGGNLRHIETIGQLRPRPETLNSVTSSMSSFSLALVERSSDLLLPSISSRSRSLRSLLDIPHDDSNRQSHSPTHRMSGMGMDFTRFRMPQDVESSDDENCDPAEAVHKTLLKLEGKYVRKNRRPPAYDSQPRYDDGDLYELALSTEDLSGASSYLPGSIRSASPPASIMVERDEETRWGRRHKHVVDGQECDTPTRHGPFTSSSLFEFIDSPRNTENHDEPGQIEDLYIPVPTVESALAELERDHLEALGPRMPAIAPPKPPESYHRSLAAHLPFILQYDSAVLARQFTLIEKDICAEIDWIELIEPTWMERTSDLVDVRDWKGFVMRDEGERGLDTVMARFNLMAGWTTSEIILTQALTERTMVVSKLIHLAVACHRLRNYATLTQIVMGLQSNHVASLNKTWEGLSSEDTKLWRELQELVDSRKNWSKMRNEMDDSIVRPRQKGEGCIPFVGIFMSDLVHVTSRSMSPGHIDFEGLRLRASIIKKTLRLIELAEEYDFKPEPGVGERCLWITSFDEATLRRIAAGLE